MFFTHSEEAADTEHDCADASGSIENKVSDVADIFTRCIQNVSADEDMCKPLVRRLLGHKG